MRPLTATALAVLVLCGCSTVRYDRGLHLDEQAVLISAVPPILQDRSTTCGGAALMAVLLYHNAAPSTRPALGSDLCARDMTTIASRSRLWACAYSGDWEDLTANVRQGRPVLVMIAKPGDPTPPLSGAPGLLFRLFDAMAPRASHWVVAVGYAPDQIILHDPSLGRLRMGRTEFERDWDKYKRLAVLVAPPGQTLTGGMP